jgi:hypothetical protein
MAIEFGTILDRHICIYGTSNNGIIVDVGCQRFVFTTRLAAAEAVYDYLVDPKGVEAKYDTWIIKAEKDPILFSDAPQTAPR